MRGDRMEKQLRGECNQIILDSGIFKENALGEIIFRSIQ
jgi:hypothetical protein